MVSIASAVELEESIQSFIALLERGITVHTVVLFGSYCNGVPHDWSDIDLAIVSPDFEGVDMPQRQSTIAHLTYTRARSISPIGYPLSEYHDPGPHSFLREIIRTGRVVYERDTE
ncbi:MAG: nucleotidyltransferase domain-containing protein [Chloroflexi bacterium]|nr:nucleotidyltransferase domain-containing protein [Chloroflexota bacterium]